MDDVELPQVAQTFGAGWHFFDRGQESYAPQLHQRPAAMSQIRPVSDDTQAVPRMQYASLVTKQLPNATATSPGTPVFILKTGMVLEVSGYGYQDNRMSYTLAGGGNGVISTDDIDWDSTLRVNNQRGVRVTLHGAHAVQGAAGE
jgi:hypothetical protein